MAGLPPPELVKMLGRNFVRRHTPGGPSPRLRPKAFTAGSTTISARLILHEAEDPGGHRAQRLRVAWDLKATGLGGSICGWGARSQHQAAVACQAHCGGFSRVPTRRFSGPRPARRQQRLAGLAEEDWMVPTLGGASTSRVGDAARAQPVNAGTSTGVAHHPDSDRRRSPRAPPLSQRD